MKLLIALAFIALARAAPEVPAPTLVKVVDGTPTLIANAASESLVKDDSPLSAADVAINPTIIKEITPVKVADAPADFKVAEKISPMKVADAPAESIAAEKISPEVVDAPADFKVAEEISPVKVADAPVKSLAAEKISPEVVDAPADLKVAEEISPVKVADAPAKSLAAEKISPEVVDAPADFKVAEEISPVKVIDAPIDVAQTLQIPDISSEMLEVNLDDPEAMRKLYQEVRNLIDISPAYVSRDMILPAGMESNIINIGGAHPFSFNNAEPLENVDTVMVVEGPVDELDYKMDPVVMVDAPAEDQAFFSDSVKVVDNVDYQEPAKGVVPREMWRGPPPMKVEQKMPAPRPTYWRDVPQSPFEHRPVYHRNMLGREGANYQMPPAAYRDPTLR